MSHDVDTIYGIIEHACMVYGRHVHIHIMTRACEHTSRCVHSSYQDVTLIACVMHVRVIGSRVRGCRNMMRCEEEEERECDRITIVHVQYN